MISAPRIIASFAVFSLLGACGLKGPLYLPPPEQAEGQAPKAEVPAQTAKASASNPKPVFPKQPKDASAFQDTPKADAGKAAPAKPAAPSDDAPALEEPPKP
jgi:predicted small lipoprotein YifL